MVKVAEIYFIDSEAPEKYLCSEVKAFDHNILLIEPNIMIDSEDISVDRLVIPHGRIERVKIGEAEYEDVKK